MSDLLQKLKEYGVDVPTVMERFVDDEELYSDCFSTFLSDDEPERLGEALAQKEYEKAFDYAHSLKGVSANLGLTPLYEKICNLVEPLRHHEYSNVDELYAETMEAFQYLQNNF